MVCMGGDVREIKSSMRPVCAHAKSLGLIQSTSSTHLVVDLAVSQPLNKDQVVGGNLVLAGADAHHAKNIHTIVAARIADGGEGMCAQRNTDVTRSLPACA